VDIADGGVRGTTSSRLLPGTHVDVHVVTRGGRVLRRARVGRALVAVVDAHRLIYEVALSFDAPIDSAPSRVVPTRWGSDGPPEPGDGIPAVDDARPEPPAIEAPLVPAEPDTAGMEIGPGHPDGSSRNPECPHQNRQNR
jgi:hypothetical protein